MLSVSLNKTFPAILYLVYCVCVKHCCILVYIDKIFVVEMELNKVNVIFLNVSYLYFYF